MLFLSGTRAQFPATRVRLSVHDHALGLAHQAMVTRGHFRGGQLSNRHRDGFAFGGNQDYFFADLSLSFIQKGKKWI